jgi:hypothetical protein
MSSEMRGAGCSGCEGCSQCTPEQEPDKVVIETQIVLTQAEFLKVNAQPGDVLFFKFKGDDYFNDDVQRLGDRLRKMFPKNKVIAMSLPKDHDVELTVLKEEVTIPEEAKDCSQPTSYCNNCNCGKKERIEGDIKKNEGKF